MSNYIALTKILLKNSLTGFSSNKKGKKNARIKSVALAAVLCISLLPLAGSIGAAVWAAYPVLQSIGQEGLLLGTGLMMISMMILFFGIFYIMNVFYFSRDTENLLPLPLRPSTIMAAKFTVTLIYEYLTELLFLVPVILAFGVASKAGIVYYLYSLIGFLTLPIIPLVYAGFINMILMRFTNISKNRDLLRIVGGILAMFIAIFANLKSQTFFSNFEDPAQIQALITQGNNSMLGIVSGLFPANKLLAIALVNSGDIRGLVNILLYLGISILLLSLFLTLGEVMYFKGLVGISETKSKRKKLTSEQFDKSVVAKSAIMSYTIKELRLLVRTPVYFLNCVMTNFIWPIFLMIPLFANTESGRGLSDLQHLVKSGSYEGIILAVAFGATLFASGSNGITSTSISREGSNIFISKYLPVSYHDQIMAKTLSGVALGLAAMLSMLAAVIYVLQPSILMILCIIATGILGVFFTAMAGMLIDLNFPKLHWDNEQKAVKQNMNLIFQMLAALVGAAMAIIPAVVFKPGLWIVLIALIVVFGFIDAVLYGLIKSIGVDLYEKIEA